MSPKESIKNDRVVEIIKDGVKTLGVRGLARAVGISPAIVTRYMQGKVGEPSQSTLQKLASYFGVSVAWLRGGSAGALERLLEGLNAVGVDSGVYNKTVAERMGKDGDYWRELVTGNALLNSECPEVLCTFFEINQYWVQTGREPTLLNAGGYVGTVETMPTVPDVKDPLLKKMIEWYLGNNPQLADYMAWCMRENKELRQRVEEILASEGDVSPPVVKI